MKAFTFLGRGPLRESTYVFGEAEYSTQFFAEAIVEFFNPESLFFCATDSAAQEPVSDEIRTNRLTFLTDLLAERTNVVHVPIPEGADEKQLWEIFNIVVREVQDNDRVLFDITHGFRSLPFLTFLALAYVRNVRRGVEIERIIYGAYEAVERDEPRKPVFDLTPFVSLLDWLGAVTMFQRSGDARPIAELIKTREALAGSELSEALTKLSEALLTNRTLDAQKSAVALSRHLDRAKSVVDQPFQTLMTQIHNSYEPLGLQNPTEPDEDLESLRKQHKQIQWYADNRQYLQAVTLTREWLISWTCLQLESDWLTGSDREKAEDNLNNWAKAESRGNPFAALASPGLPQRDLCLRLWRRVRSLRNSLAHCGMPGPTQELRGKPIRSSSEADIREAQGILKDLNTLVETTLT